MYLTVDRYQGPQKYAYKTSWHIQATRSSCSQQYSANDIKRYQNWFSLIALRLQLISQSWITCWKNGVITFHPQVVLIKACYCPKQHPQDQFHFYLSLLTVTNFRLALGSLCLLPPYTRGENKHFETAGIEPGSSCSTSNRSNHHAMAPPAQNE